MTSRAQLLRRTARLLAFGAVLALSACRGYPRDPDGTLDRVLATKAVRVVAVDHPPWVVASGGATPTGVEADLVEALARELGVAVEWRRAPAFEALDALDHGEADLAIGGFTQREVDAYGIAAGTYAYFAEETVVAARPGTPSPRDIDGRRVLSPDLTAAGLVRAEGGVPVTEGDADLVALPRWQLPEGGLVPTEIVLGRAEHILAVPKGENAWIMRVERVLRGQAGDVGARLRSEEP